MGAEGEMTGLNLTAHLAVTCDFCSAKNELTIQQIGAQHSVTCSQCGGKLGTVGELLGGLNDRGSKGRRQSSLAPSP
jgi:hypothetical protein